MKRSAGIRHLTVGAVLTITLGMLSHANAENLSPGETLPLSELIQEALGRNPEIQAVRQQWEAASQRVAQARSLDDPTLQVQWWNFPESFNVGQAANTIIGVSQKFPFP